MKYKPYFNPNYKTQLPLYASLVVLLPFLFISGPNWLSSTLGAEIKNFGHFIFFGILTYLTYSFLPLKQLTKSILILLATLSIGIIVEYIQAKIGRNASWEDIVRNLMGSGLMLCWLYRSNIIVWTGRVLFSALIAFQFYHLCNTAIQSYQTYQMFPVLSNFESDADFSRWKGSVELSTEFVSEGEFSMKAKFKATEYSRISLASPRPDWTNFSKLCFDLYNPDKENFELTFRIDDKYYQNKPSDRFNSKLTISPNWNHFCFSIKEIRQGPSSRKMKIDSIKSVWLYSYQFPRAIEVYTDNWRLL